MYRLGLCFADGAIDLFWLLCRVLENVKEIWTEYPSGGAKGKPVVKDRIINKMFLRGDSVILVLRNPN